MKKDSRKRRWWLREEEPLPELTPEEEQFMLSLMGGCMLPFALLILVILIALFSGHA